MNEQDILLIKQYPDAFKSTLEMVRKVDFTLKASGIVQKEPVTWENCTCEGCKVYREERICEKCKYRPSTTYYSNLKVCQVCCDKLNNYFDEEYR